MLISATLSKPSKDTEEKLGRPYVKIRIWKNPSPAAQKNSTYISEAFTEKQSFTKNLSEKEAEQFVREHGGTTFKNCVERTESEEITYMANRHGEIKKLVKKSKAGSLFSRETETRTT